MLESKVIENLFRSHLVGPETIGLLAFLRKDLDRALSLHILHAAFDRMALKLVSLLCTFKTLQNVSRCCSIRILFLNS